MDNRCTALLQHSVTGEVLLQCDLSEGHLTDMHFDATHGAEWRKPYSGIMAVAPKPIPPREDKAYIYDGPPARVTIHS